MVIMKDFLVFQGLCCDLQEQEKVCVLVLVECQCQEVVVCEEVNIFCNSIGQVVFFWFKVVDKVYYLLEFFFFIFCQYLVDEQVVLLELFFDEFIVDMFMDSDENFSFVCFGVGMDVLSKLWCGNWVIQVQLDLYGYCCDQVCEVLGEFLCQLCCCGLCCVWVIYGKGFGLVNKEFVFKYKVCNWLVQKDEVMVFCQVCVVDGGVGVLVVLLCFSEWV